MWILYVLLFTYIVMIDIFINAPGHGEIKIDSIRRDEKKYLI